MRNYAWVGIIRNCAYNCANLCMLDKNVRNITYLLICDVFFNRLSPRQMNLTNDVSKISTNSSGTIAVLSDFDGNLISVDLSTERVLCKFPEYDASPIACFEIHPKSDNVIVVYADSHFVECSAKSGKFTKFSTNFLASESLTSYLPKQFLSKNFSTSGIVFPHCQVRIFCRGNLKIWEGKISFFLGLPKMGAS